MHRIRFAVGLACIAAVLVFVAGCGDGDDTTASSNAETGATTTGASGEPVKISVGSLVNNPAFSWPGVFAGVKAAAETINAEGGIGPEGQPLEVVTCDNQLDPNKANVCARDAVSAGVIADVGSADPFSPATTPIFAAADIPRVALIQLAPSDATAPDTYSITGGGNGMLLGAGPVLAAQGITKVGWVEPEPNLPENVDILKEGLEAAGVTLVGRVPVPGEGVSDYAPYAQQVQDLVDQGAEAVLANISAPFFDLVKTFEQLGGETTWYQLSQVDNKQIKAAGATADGIYNISYLPPATATDLPAVQEWVDQMAALGGEGSDQLDAQSFNAWLGVYALKLLVEEAEGPITNETVNELLASAENIDVQGLFEWSPAAKGPPGYTNITNGDVWLSEVVNGEEQLDPVSPIDIFG